VRHVSKHGLVGKKNIRGRVIRPSSDKDGYLLIHLSLDGVPSTHKVHRLVADHFVPNTENLPEINHENLIKDDNVWTNLKWSTRKKNQTHARDNGKFHAETNSRRAKTIPQKCVNDIRNRSISGQSCKKIADLLGMRYGTVWRIIKQGSRVLPNQEIGPR
jgi:hypothetical protein